MSIVTTIEDFQKMYFEVLSISLADIKLEEHNAKYSGVRFKLNKHSVRFRKAKLTPNKAGFFVVAWEKDDNNNNQAYSYNDSPDHLMVYCETESRQGIFIFPKDALLKNNILSTDKQKGKMGFRVYPTWEELSSKQALQSQKWQSEHFVNLSDGEAIKAFKSVFK